MQVILRSDVADLGHKGEVLDVADGYARNYLVPNGLALVATPGVIRQAEAMARAREARDAEARAEAERLAAELEPTPIAITAKAGEGGRLFGSVTTADIAAAVADQVGVEVDRRKVQLAEPIRELGTHTVRVKLHPDVEIALSVEVEAEPGS